MNTFHNIVMLVFLILTIPFTFIIVMMYSAIYLISVFVCEIVWRNDEDCEMNTWKINEKLNEILTKIFEKISII